MLASSRHQWEEGWRRLDEERHDALRHRQLADLVEIVIGGLRRRLGSVFTLTQLDELYADSERWVSPAVSDNIPGEDPRVTPADSVLVQDAAFLAYARGAVDYRP